MRKLLLTIIAIIFAIPSFAQNGVKWESGTFQEALNKVKSKKKGPKLVFMDCYTTWCGPCKYMAEKIFPTKEAGDYFNKHFVNFKQDMEKGEGIELAQKYEIASYPTFLILDGDGNEIGRIVGGGDLDKFIKRVENAKDPSKSIHALLKKYEETKDIEYAFSYLDVASENYMTERIIDFMCKYYDNFESEIYSDRAWKYTSEAISLSNPYILDKILSDKYNYDKAFTKGTVDNKLKESLTYELYEYLMGEKEVAKEIIDKACELMKLISTGNKFEEIIVKSAKLYSNKDIKGIMGLFDARTLGYEYGYNERSRIQRIILNMKEIPDAERVRFLKENKEYAESLLKSAERMLNNNIKK
jgi:Thiol:disulfide interchange protein